MILKKVVCNLVSICFNSPQLFNPYWSRDILNFKFLEKGVGLVSPSYFVYDFSRKMFLMLHCINWPNSIVWLPLLLKVLDNMCITIVCLPGCDVIKFEINLIFLIMSLCYMTKKSRQKLKYLENEKSFCKLFKLFAIKLLSNVSWNLFCGVKSH